MAILNNTIYRLTCESYIENPLLLHKDTDLYMVGFRKPTQVSTQGDLIFRKIVDDGNIAPLIGGQVVDWLNNNSEPYIFIGEPPSFGILASNITQPWYFLDSNKIYFTYVQSGIKVGKYDLNGNLYTNVTISSEGAYPIIVKDPIVNKFYIFYKVNNNIKVAWSNTDADSWHVDDLLYLEYINKDIGFDFHTDYTNSFDKINMVYEDAVHNIFYLNLYIDLLPPEISNIIPAIDATGVKRRPKFSFTVCDNIGVRLDTINVTIDGTDIIVNGIFQNPYTGTIVSNSCNGYDIIIDSFRVFDLSYVVLSTISFYDTSGNYEYLTYNFTITDVLVVVHLGLRRFAFMRRNVGGRSI